MLNYAKWPVVEDRHRSAVASVVNSGTWHYGGVYRQLESRLSGWLGRPAITTSSCAWSLFLALCSLSIKGRVVVPAYGYVGTVHPVVWAGAQPFFADCDPVTFNICPNSLQSILSNNTIDAVIGVHVHGMPFDYDIVEICNRFGVPLIEDVCQAQGARLRGNLVGTLGELGAFSFNTRKTLPAGLGGAVTTGSQTLATRIENLRDYGIRDVEGDQLEVGYYLPIGEFDAALVLVQLDDLDPWIEQSDRFATIIREAIPRRFPLKPSDRTHTWHKVRIKGTEDERLRLETAGIITSRWAPKPLTEYPCYSSFLTTDRFPGAVEICESTFCIFNDDFPIAPQSEDLVRDVARILEVELS